MLQERNILKALLPSLAAFPGVALGPGDDCAALEIPGENYLLAAVDQLIAHVHFDPAATPPGLAGAKLMKRNLPGAFTFILNTSSRMPDRALEKRKSVGVRIPANPISRAIVERLGCPLITTSVKRNPEDDGDEYTTDPELIEERYGNRVDLIVDGGIGDNVPTTLVDLTSDEQEILREGRSTLK